MNYELCRQSPISDEKLIALRKDLRSISKKFYAEYGLSIQSVKLVGLGFTPVIGVEVGIEEARVTDYVLDNGAAQIHRLAFDLTDPEIAP